MAYLRTSSATNVGADKDSDKRQRDAITTFARRAGYELLADYYDQAVRGADALVAGDRDQPSRARRALQRSGRWPAC